MTGGGIAFVANGNPITTAARDACLAVIARPAFTANECERALVAAGVPRDDYTAARAADRLRQRERKAGRIEPVPGKPGMWRRVA